MSLSLTPELEQAIVEKVKSGRYQSVDEVLLEGLRLLEKRDRTLDEQQLEELRQKIAVGTEQIGKGQVTDGEIVFEQLQTKIWHNQLMQFAGILSDEEAAELQQTIAEEFENIDPHAW